jgi:phage terminase small subunit
VAKGKSHVKAKAKLESFARQYIINHFNGQQAAIAAGFAPKSARITAAKLLAKANVQERIASLLAAANKKLDYSIEKTLQQIARHAFADPRVLFNSDGSMKKITELDEDAAAMIGGVELSGKRVKRVNNRCSASARYAGAFSQTLCRGSQSGRYGRQGHHP